MATYFTPSYNYHIIPESDYLQTILTIEKNLANYITTGTFSSKDGLNLAYAYALAQDAKATIVILHGFTEFYHKYDEMTWYYLHMGYNVFLYDQRGHGLSESDCPDPKLTHVNAVEEYVDDLADFIDKVVLPITKEEGEKGNFATPLPLYIFAHSMGGTVTTLYLSDPRCKADKAILSSPMVRPYTSGVPNPVVLMEIKAYVKRHGGWMTRFPHARDFNPNATIDSTEDESFARFRHNLDLRIANPRYQGSASTNRWMYETLTVQKKMLDRKRLSRIHTKVLFFLAGHDTVVLNKPQYTLAKRIPNCELVVYPNSKHTIYTTTEPDLSDYYRRIFAFLG